MCAEGFLPRNGNGVVNERFYSIRGQVVAERVARGRKHRKEVIHMTRVELGRHGHGSVRKFLPIHLCERTTTAGPIGRVSKPDAENRGLYLVEPAVDAGRLVVIPIR